MTGTRLLTSSARGVLLGDRLQEELWLQWLRVRAFERIGQKNVRTVGRQLPAVVAQRAADAQFTNRIRTDHLFKAV